MKVKFSILVPLYNTPENFLREMIESVLNQTYKNWELCLADASDEEHAETGRIVRSYSEKDPRICYKKLAQNGGISENTNACIGMSTGNYYALLDHDDVLDSRALSEVARVIRRQHADFIYTDEAKFTESIQKWFAPNYKPDFSKYELRAHNYICHLTVYSRELLERAGGRYRAEFDGSQDHDMVLRLTENAKKIVHISKVLYYWRVHGGSVSSGVENKSYAVDAAIHAVQEQLKRSGEKGRVVNHSPWLLLYHPLYEIEGAPSVSVVLYPADDAAALRQCIESFEIHAGYENYQYLIPVKEGDRKNIEKELDEIENTHPVCFVEGDWTNGFEKADKDIRQLGGDHLLFLHSRSKISSKGFLLELLRLSQRKDVWAVGPKILSVDGKIRHAGVAFSAAAENGVVFRFCGELAESDGYEAALRHIRNVSAVSEECCMIQKTKYEKTGGFAPGWDWYRGYNGCLCANQKGYVNVWTPYAELTCGAEISAPEKEEEERFRKTWKAVYAKEDPYYNRFIRYDVDHIHDKNTAYSLMKKSVTYLSEEGVSGLLKRVNVYKGKGGEQSSIHVSYAPCTVKNHVFRDVLFINGCAPSVPHPPRYRVAHQREQLEACGITTDCVYYEELNPDLVTDFRSFIFFRCPYTENVGELIRRAKKLNRLVLFDIDDLVIDTKYTDTIPYVMSLDEAGKRVYDDGVIRMGKTLKLCDAAITTTERLAEELSHYVPEVLINRNVASERMYELSEQAVYDRDVLPFLKEEELPENISHIRYQKACEAEKRRDKEKVHIGYFSGSITHNADFDMIRPALIRILKEFPNVNLHLVGELDLPQELKPYGKQIIAEPFTDWERLPKLIASVDINLAPITVSIFNEAKSENKWTEAALVKVPTVASNTGAFAVAIKQNETGLLCESEEEWYQALRTLVLNADERKRLAENAYQHVKQHYITTYTGKKLADYITRKRNANLAFVLPSAEISGGIMVALKHACMMKRRGVDVFILCDSETVRKMELDGEVFELLSIRHTQFGGRIDQCVATMWSTLSFVQHYRNIGRRRYLIQNYETDFYKPGDALRGKAEQTYYQDVEFLTISRWCESWLRERYGKTAAYMPNGISVEQFYPVERSFDGKIRILIEGDSSVYYKNVDESFRIAAKLDPETYEIWYLSYKGKAKDWYRVDKFMNRVPYEKVADIYRQ